MSSLGHLMQDLAEAMDVPFQVDRGVYSLEMPTASGRSQLVQVALQDSSLGEEMILFYTPVGPVSDGIDWRSLLEMNVGTIYAVAPHLTVVTNTTEPRVLWWHLKAVLAVSAASKAVEVPERTAVHGLSTDGQ